MSCLTTSATRRSRSVPAAVLIASAAAASQDVLLVPMISVTRYTLITLSLDHVRPAARAAAASLSHSRPARSAMQAAGWFVVSHDHGLHPDGPDRRGRRDQRPSALPRLSRLRLHDGPDPGRRRRLPGQITSQPEVFPAGG